MDLVIYFPNPFLSLLTLSPQLPVVSLWEAVQHYTENNFLWSDAFIWCSTSFSEWSLVLLEGSSEQQLCIYFIWGLHDFVNFDHTPPQTLPCLTEASFILVILIIACSCTFSSIPPLSKGTTRNDVTTAAAVGTRKSLKTSDHVRDWGSIILDGTLWSKQLRQKVGGEGVKRWQWASDHSIL